MGKYIRSNDWVDDDGFFTRDDCIEYIEEPLEDAIRDTFSLNSSDPIWIRCYIEDGNRLDVDIDTEDFSTNIKLDKPIDMRRIRRPSDLQKYVPELLDKFTTEYTDIVSQYEVFCSDELAVDVDIPVVVVLDRETKETLDCPNIRSAQFEVMEYIEDNGLGSGSSEYSDPFVGGEVFDADTHEYLGHISYNGRFWSAGHKWDKENYGLIRDWVY